MFMNLDEEVKQNILKVRDERMKERCWERTRGRGRYNERNEPVAEKI